MSTRLASSVHEVLTLQPPNLMNTPSFTPKPSSYPSFLASLLALVILCALPVHAQGIPDADKELAWSLYADSIQTLEKDTIIKAKGHVLLVQGENFLQADEATYNKATQWLSLNGSIKANWDGDLLEGDSAEFDLGNKQGWLTNAHVFLEDNHIFLVGEKIRKTGNSTYTFKQATVTSCDGDRPAWSLTTTSGDVTIDGYARLWNPRFQVKNLPVLYSPWLIVPVKTRRQSGFLLPEFEVSKQLGTHINLPYYQVINDENDLTLYENFMSKRGLMQGVEFRSTPNLDTMALVRMDWLHDRQDYKDGQYVEDGWQRPHADRYWLRGKFDGYAFSPSWQVKMDMDLVSDYAYLREFGKGLSGFEQSDKDFTQEFGRGVNEDDDFLRKNVFLIHRDWSNMGIDLRLEYIQNLAYFNDNTKESPSHNPTIQRLPEINFNVYKHALFSTPLEWEMASTYTYFWREYGTKGSRLDVHPALSLPLHTAYGSIIPRVGWRETLYAVDHFENTPQTVHTDNNYPVRGIPDASLELTTHLFRVYEFQTPPIASKDNLGEAAWTKIKHSLYPDIEYSFIPNTLAQQNKNPFFDGEDRIYPESNLTYFLTNVITGKRLTVVQDPQSKDNASITRAEYWELFRLKFKQSYDFREAERTEDTSRYPNRPFSDISAELTISPREYMSLTSTSWYSPYENRITEHEHILHLFRKDVASAYCGLDFVNREQEYIYKTNYLGAGERSRILTLGGEVCLPKNWWLGIDYKSDLEQGKDLTRKLTLTHKHQCFTFTCFLEKTDTDEKIAVNFTKGIGGKQP